MNRIDEILDRIYQLLGIKRDSEFCEKYKIKPNTLSTWRKRNKIPYELIEEISQNENLSLDEILLNSNKYPQTENNNLIELPYYPETYAAAGGGAINYQDVKKPIAFNKDFLEKTLGITIFKNLHIINAIGNSMEPTIEEGELLFVNPFENEYNQIRDGGIYVINCNNSVFVKRIHHNPITKEALLISDNKQYPDMKISGQEFNSCKVIGRVVGHFSSF